MDRLGATDDERIEDLIEQLGEMANNMGAVMAENAMLKSSGSRTPSPSAISRAIARGSNGRRSASTSASMPWRRTRKKSTLLNAKPSPGR